MCGILPTSPYHKVSTFLLLETQELFSLRWACGQLFPERNLISAHASVKSWCTTLMMGEQPVSTYNAETTYPWTSKFFASYLPMSAGCVFFHKRFLSSKVLTLFLLHLSALLQPVVAVLKNVTIDDQNGDGVSGTFPIYAPQVAWANQDCAGCAIGYDTARLFRHTATAATFMPDRGFSSNTVDFDFNGMIGRRYLDIFSQSDLFCALNGVCHQRHGDLYLLYSLLQRRRNCYCQYGV